MKCRLHVLAAVGFIALSFFACGGGNSSTGSGPPPPSAAHQWTWISGTDADLPWDNSNPVYGTQGVASPANVPGGRNSAVSWTDANGNLWLFGGFGLDATIAQSALNDLWEFSPVTNEWVWVNGSSTAGTTNCSSLYVVCGQQGVYGILGMPSSANVPGGRFNGVSWADTSGNLWLFGGLAFDSIGTFGYMNDLWKFNLANKQWTWVSGSNTVQRAEIAVYGTKGIAALGNVPLGLARATGWVDKAGNLWLFGGINYQGSGIQTFGIYNNLWEFTPSTGLWKWVGGGGSNYNQPPTYGVIGVPSASNDPGARVGPVGWLDGGGSLWLFGGHNGNEIGPGALNDLWKFDPTTGQWTWISGSNNPAAGTPGQYGTKGFASAANVPGGRSGATGWIDSRGKIWLFGGDGYDSTLSSTGGVVLNDLWQFDASTAQWTWVGGSNIGWQPGTYGTKGRPSPSNVPGGRYHSSSWVDSKGNFWVFAGWGLDSNPTGAEGGSTILNDLWCYQPY